MILSECPWCGTKHVQTVHVWGPSDDGSPQQEQREQWQVQQCQNPACRRFILHRSVPTGGFIGLFPAASYELPSDVQDIPDEVRNDYREAGKCLDAGCYKASMVMSRRALQRCLKEQGCTQKKLADAIQHAVANGMLRTAFHPLAEEIRQFGNLSAHPDDDQLKNANEDNAKHVLHFVKLLVEEFYEVPARATSLQKKREDAAN